MSSQASATLSTNAKDLYKQGQLSAAINKLIEEVRENPGDIWRRTFLFELLCFNGEWERAERQLKALSIIGAKAEIGIAVYGNNIKNEIARSKLFSNGLAPTFLIPPPKYVSLQLEAINKLREKDYIQARTLLDKAMELQPELKGAFNGKAFNYFSDYNDFLSSCLEVFLKDQYLWIPFEHIKRLEVYQPKQLRELVWAKAAIELTNGSMGEIFLPALYTNSFKHENELVRLGRLTDWQKLSEDLYMGYGLRTFLVNSEEKTLFEIVDLTFENAEENTEEKEKI